MLLTRKATNASVNPAASSRLTRPVSSMLGRTVDRRTFLKVGDPLSAGASRSSSRSAWLRSASRGKRGGEPLEGTHHLHALLVVAIDATCRTRVVSRPFRFAVNLGAHCAKGASIRGRHDARLAPGGGPTR